MASSLKLKLKLEVLLSFCLSCNQAPQFSKVSDTTISELAEYIMNQCPQLQLRGLMTIGATGDLSCFDRSKTIILISTVLSC